MSKARIITAAAAVCLGLSACGGGASGDGLAVFADGSLTDAYRALAAAFEDAHPGVEVHLTFDDSAALAGQILSGTSADVFASADAADIASVTEADGAAVTPQVFARNLLQIAVPWSNPAGISDLEDFADPGLMIGLCAASYPCGADALEALALAGITPSIDNTEEGSRALLNEIEARELDAGIVFATDVAAEAGYVEGIAIPDEFQAAETYQIVALSGNDQAGPAGEFVAFVLSAEGQQILESYGLVAP
jgi:molybdate transport system substrate-binding protein